MRRTSGIGKPFSRKDAFFGLHFDLHPSAGDTALGADVTEEMVERLLRKVRPDFVQYDCKGHAGYAGYATKVGWAAPGIVNDSLAIWRKATKRHGVGLFIHYSGAWDSQATQHHPEWARVDEKGKPDKDINSTFGHYVDQLLIPQLKEVMDAYDLDGAWVDGDCWAVKPDYSPAAADAWKKLAGLPSGGLPRKVGDRHWRRFLDFNREQFRKYVRKYVDAVHEHRPGFQITSNWMYSSMMPDRLKSLWTSSPATIPTPTPSTPPAWRLGTSPQPEWPGI
jgi:hypothetical protein